MGIYRLQKLLLCTKIKEREKRFSNWGSEHIQQNYLEETFLEFSSSNKTGSLRKMCMPMYLLFFWNQTIHRVINTSTDISWLFYFLNMNVFSFYVHFGEYIIVVLYDKIYTLKRNVRKISIANYSFSELLYNLVDSHIHFPHCIQN